MIDKRLIEIIRAQFRLDWHGIHGARHWSRVRENGLRLATQTGARSDVVELFAFLHGSQRVADGADLGHGPRAAQFVSALRCQGVLRLDGEGFELLSLACTFHSNGLTAGDVTVLTCWDADRLDLGRVGTYPDPRYLCTDAARNAQVIMECYNRSRWQSPRAFVFGNWEHEPK